MKTLCLVLGNNDYDGSSKLKNAINDAYEISEVFKRLGYDVIYKYDVKSADYADLLSEYESRINSYDASFKMVITKLKQGSIKKFHYKTIDKILLN